MAYVKAQLEVLQQIAATGLPLSGGSISAYIWDTSTPTPMYTSSAGAGSATSFTLNALGQPQSAGGTAVDIFLDSTVTYKFIIRDSAGTAVGPTIGPVYAGNASEDTVIADVSNASALALDVFMATNLSLYNFGVTTSSTTAAITSALQTAIDSASAAKLKLKIPAGTWLLTPATTQVWEGAGDMLCAALLKSNLFLWGDGIDNSVLKIANGVSSDGAPQQMAMFFTNSQLENIRMEGITIDMNGANNLISPNRGSGTYNRYNQAHIHVTGTVGGVAARVDGVHIDKCKFINTPGVTCIGMAQSNTASVTLGKVWRIIDCDFENNGLDSDDHSSIYAWADDVIVDNCRFVNSTMHGTTGNTGGVAAYEFHGAHQKVTNCIIKNYYQGCWMSGNQTSACNKNLFAHNTLYVKDFGVGFYRESASETAIHDIEIINNIMELSDDSTAEGLKAGIKLNASYTIYGVTIKGNRFTKTGTNESSCGLLLGPQSVAAQPHTLINFEDNEVVGMCFGGYIGTTVANGLGEIVFANNTMIDLDDTAAFPDIAGLAVNIVGSNTIDSLVFERNDVISRNGVCDRGLYIAQGIVTNLYYDGNNYKAMAVENYSQGSATINNYHGRYPTLYHSPVWKFGATTITLGNGTINGYWTKHNETCFYTAKLVAGSTTTFPSGTLNVSIPLASTLAGVKYIGECLVIDAGTGTRYQGQAVIDGTASVAVFEQSGGTFFTETSPITLTTSDELHICITYRVAD